MIDILLQEWTGPAGGVPAFDRAKPTELVAAFTAAAASFRAEIAAIVDDPAAPTFANVFGALDLAGDQLSRVETYYETWCSSLKTDEMRAIQAELEPRQAALRDEFVQNAGLFAKIERVAQDSAQLAVLTPEQRRLVEVRHRHFVLRGARLTSAAKHRVGEINQRLATLGSTFDDNILVDERSPALVLDHAGDLDGLPESFVQSAAAEAERRGLSGKFVIGNTRSSVEPFLSFAVRRDLRERAFRAWTARGEAKNLPLIDEILRLRLERAKLYGFATHAHWKLADKMITDPRRAVDLMTAVWRPALAQARRDIAAMQAMIDGEKEKFTLEAWDHRFYAERVRRARFDLDPELVRPYMRYDNVRDAMFSVAGKLYGLKFTPFALPTFDPDIETYRVDDARGLTGIFYLDPYARPGKSSGAWMSQYRPQRYRAGRREVPIVSNNSNFIKGPPGQPVLLSWDDARTLFHEFGHGLHGLLSDVRYAALQGTAVATDYVEFPSHFHENFMRTSEVLSQLVNADGDSLPYDLILKIKRAENFNAAFATVEFLGPALLDMMMHVSPDPIDPAAFTKKLLSDIGMPKEIAPRHALAHFAHAFSGDGYSAGYYSYLWSDVMACDGFEAFSETGDAYDPAVARRLKENVLSAGNRFDPAEGYRKFRGRDPDVAALLRARGLTEDAL